MTRRVRGFLTSDGTFFDTKIQADVYEATQVFHVKLNEGMLLAGIDPNTPFGDYLKDAFRAFILANKDVVARYITLMPSMSIPDWMDEPDTGPVTNDPGPSNCHTGNNNSQLVATTETNGVVRQSVAPPSSIHQRVWRLGFHVMEGDKAAVAYY